MKSLFKKLLILIFICLLPASKIFAEDKIRIGLVVPLSGEYSTIGDSIIKSTRLALNKINNEKFEIVPGDTKANPIDALKASKALYDQGIKIIIGPVFNESTKYLDELNDVTFISFTNKIYGNPTNVISAGVNAISQFQTIDKFRNLNDIERTIILIPKSDYKKEVEQAVTKTKFKLKDKYFYDMDPTLLTSQIEKVTRYPERKQNLINEIERIENSSLINKEKKLEELNKKDTLGGINFDSVIIADFGESLKSVATSLLYTDVSSKRISYITLNQWFDNSLLKENSLQPIYFPSINKENFELFKAEYENAYKKKANQLSFLSYDLVGLVYFLLYSNNFEHDKKIFYEKNKFKGKIGVFEIDKNTITHQLNFYSIENEKFIKIF
ncbi:ABC transporter substrate-binding protein [Candidatus Pelagibacter sp.]|nr:ABC transporter substrate-binding protein [Candidatus Pelagibacter sp.]